MDELTRTHKKIERHLPDLPKAGKSTEITLASARDVVELMASFKHAEELRNNDATAVLTRSLFMQMFSEFDVFVGALLKSIYTRNDGMLKGITREISLADLLEYENIDAVKRAMLDKEIDTFRRDSYIEQFNGLEKKFGLSLKKFPEWCEFVELGQRRNILTHNGGMVSDQYLVICDREGCKFEKRPIIGEVLQVDVKYFSRALRLLSKIGFMLSHTLWAKVFPKESDVIHESINDSIYDCLEQKRWRLASELGEFALSEAMRKGVPELLLRIRVVNVAIGLKFSENSEAATKLLHSLDWTASYRDFRLALAVLEENFDEAIAIMESIGKAGEVVRQHSYHSWPLFTKFRERPEFYAAYERIYGESFASKEASEASIAAGAEPSSLARNDATGNTSGARLSGDADLVTAAQSVANTRGARVPRRPRPSKVPTESVKPRAKAKSRSKSA